MVYILCNIFISNILIKNSQKEKIKKWKKRGEKQRKIDLKYLIYYKIKIDFRVTKKYNTRKEIKFDIIHNRRLF